MSSCTNWVTQQVITCKNWSQEIVYECNSWRDEGTSQCQAWADEGSSQCTSWEECHWYTPWDCIAGFFCRAWYWVANWVCQGWYWVADLVCLAFAAVLKLTCVLFSWALDLVCVAWDTVRCAMVGLLNWLSQLLFGRGRQKPPPIENVFVLMFENRSFDHMFGFSGITGIDIDGNPTSINGVEPAVIYSNVDPQTNAVVQVSPNADFALKGIDKDPGHEFPNTLMSLCGPDAAYDPVLGGYPSIDNSGFIANYLLDPSADPGERSTTPDRIMRCYDTQKQLPVLYQLASEFALCDQWFSSLPGPTWPNRFFLLAASSGGLDGSPSNLDVVTSTSVEGYRFDNGTIFDLLDDRCIDWKIYEGDDFPVSFAMSGMNLNWLQGRFRSFDDFPTDLLAPGFAPKFVFIEPKYGAHGFDVTGPGDFSCGNSMHPLDDVTRGEQLLKDVYEAIRNSPLWEKSLLIVCFDEHGGFYDHVAPPAAVPPGDTITESYVQNGFLFDQLGVRVPALVISPLVERGVIDHTQYDHTSMLATAEKLFGLKNLTNRDKAANDLLHLVSLKTPRTDTPETLHPPAVNPNPLSCDDEGRDDPETADKLLINRSELRLAQRSGVYRDRRIDELPVTPTQIGFVQIALLKIAPTAPHPERQQWIDQYKAINTSVDAALFMTEARLKLQHGIDMKRFDRADNPDRNLATP
jgi:phospholipase C